MIFRPELVKYNVLKLMSDEDNGGIRFLKP